MSRGFFAREIRMGRSAEWRNKLPHELKLACLRSGGRLTTVTHDTRERALHSEKWTDLLDVAQALVAAVRPLRFRPPVTHVYNPLEYAFEPYATYVTRYGTAPKEVVMLGMNPGPWGMAQTGVPFGEVTLVRDWLGIRGPVGKPRQEHPQRPVMGFSCPRREVSGLRIWGWARERFKTPRLFFRRFFVANYCPLMFLTATGRNRTPDRLPAGERAALLAACDEALRQTVQRLRPRFVVGVGRFAEARARTALTGANVIIGHVLHPSPASPAANRDWGPQATRQLRALGIEV